MRQVGILSHENQARRLVNFLGSLGIESKCEVTFEPANGQMHYQIWIRDEDRIEEASHIFVEFEKNPLNTKFDSPEPEPEPVKTTSSPKAGDSSLPAVHHFKTHLTHFFIALCALIFFLSVLQRMELTKAVGQEQATQRLVPIQALFMYDLPPAGNAPYWQGIYGWVVAKLKGENPTSVEGPLFVQIREGQIWRLFTPCILHKDLLHILFNMLWLWYLGRPIEMRIGPFRTLILTIIAGVLTNTIQYLASGPMFIGYSGIVTALAGFIWMRERKAPWEGYPLTRGTILVLLSYAGILLPSLYLHQDMCFHK